MEKHSCIFNSKLWPGGLFVCLGLIVLFETAVALLPEFLIFDPPYEQKAMELKAETVEKHNAYDVLILGDSFAWAGVIPEIIDRKLSVETYNLALNSQQTYLMNYILLKRYIKNCEKKPKLVIMVITASSLTWSDRLSLSDIKDFILPYIRHKSEFLNELDLSTRLSVTKYLLLTTVPSIKRQYIFRDNIFKRVRNKKLYEKHIEEYKRYKGYMFNPAVPKNNGIDVEDIVDRVKYFQLSQLNTVYLLRILDLLEKNGIQTVLVGQSVRAELNQWFEEYGIYEKVEDFIEKISSPFGNVLPYLPMHDVAGNPALYKDETHLSYEGAALYTQILTQRINQRDCPLLLRK